MKLLSFLLLLALSAASCSDDNSSAGGTGGTGGKVYLRSVMVSYPSSYLTLQWIYLGDDGKVVFDPKHGVNPVDYAAETRDNAGNTGTYVLNGDELEVELLNGEKQKLSVERADGELSAIDGGLVSRQRGVPDGFTLNGQYSGGAVTANLSNTTTYAFNADGTFSLASAGGVSTEGGSALSEGQQGGTYRISGNTLTLRFADGTEQKAVIGIMDMGEGMEYLIINGSSFRLQN